MGFRFRRSFKIAPGVRLNASKSGLSTSIGTLGAWWTIGRRGTRSTVGLPGTGLRYTEEHRYREPSPGAPGAPSRVVPLLVAFLILMAILYALRQMGARLFIGAFWIALGIAMLYGAFALWPTGANETSISALTLGAAFRIVGAGIVALMAVTHVVMGVRGLFGLLD